MVNAHRLLPNSEISAVFKTIADLLDIKGDNIYKILAYRRAAEIISETSQDVAGLWRARKLSEIQGVGKAIAEKIDELLTTGQLNFLIKLEEEVPLSLLEMLQVPGVGPRKAALFWRQAGITDLEGLLDAAQAARLRSLPGMGAKSEVKIIEGIAALRRRSGRIPLGIAWPAAQELLTFLRSLPGVIAAEPAGSLRRMRATIGDIDLVAAAVDPRPVMDAFSHYPSVLQVLGSGDAKSSVELAEGLRAQLWVQPPERFGTVLQFATGSKEHNVRLRELALSRGYSLSEKELAYTSKEGSLLCASEDEVYRVLGLPWIPPELREDRGEIDAARQAKLPNLVRTEDMRADLHCHSTWSDGRASILEMAGAAIQRGLQILAITDHTYSLGIANGLTADGLLRQRAEIDDVQRQLGDRLLLLQGSEVEIHADGSLDFPDDVLARLDFVIASLHTSLRQPRDVITPRLIQAINNPHVDAIAHPTGGLLPDRESSDLDMEAVFHAAAERGVALEINANPSRLDLDDVHSRRAVELGVKLTINRDAHIPEDVGRLEFGVATARRGWVKAASVIHTFSPPVLLAWLKSRQVDS